MPDPIAQISKAEQALIAANDIVEILELRTKAKAVEVIAVAENMGDIAQQAKIFQLRAERKAGSWLAVNMTTGRPSNENTRITLESLDISPNDSSRWQLMATLPEEKFNGWLDERLMKGQEITAGGLRQYAKNVTGKQSQSGTVYATLVLDPKGCSLQGFGIRCDGPPTGGHIINKSKTQGNAEGRAILVEQARLFNLHGEAEIMSTQCSAHNVGRIADTPRAVQIQLLQKIYKYGYSHMASWFDEFLATFKEHRTELELERLLDP